MPIRRAATREGGLCTEKVPKERRTRRDIRSLAAAVAVAVAAASLLLSFLPLSTRALAVALRRFDIHWIDRDAIPPPAHSKRRRMGGEEGEHEERMLLLLLSCCSRSLFFRLLYFRLGWPPLRGDAARLLSRPSPLAGPRHFSASAIATLSDLLDGAKEKTRQRGRSHELARIIFRREGAGEGKKGRRRRRRGTSKPLDL